MKKFFLLIIMTMSVTCLFSQNTFSPNPVELSPMFSHEREGWQASAGGAVGFAYDGMAFLIDGELGKHISPKLYVGGGLSFKKFNGSSFGLYVSPRYYYSEKVNSFYVEASLGITLLGMKYYNERYGIDSSWEYEKHRGATTGIAVGYVFNEQLSVELGLEYEHSDRYREYNREDIYSYNDFACLLKANYTFDLGNNLFKGKNK